YRTKAADSDVCIDRNSLTSKVKPPCEGWRLRSLQREVAIGIGLRDTVARPRPRRQSRRSCGLRRDLARELRNWPGFHQSRAHRFAHEVVYKRLLSETHLDLRRMHIGVNLLIRQLDEQENDRKDGRRQNVAISLCDCVLHQAVTNQSPIDEDK